MGVMDEWARLQPRLCSAPGVHCQGRPWVLKGMRAGGREGRAGGLLKGMHAGGHAMGAGGRAGGLEGMCAGGRAGGLESMRAGGHAMGAGELLEGWRARGNAMGAGGLLEGWRLEGVHAGGLKGMRAEGHAMGARGLLEGWRLAGVHAGGQAMGAGASALALCNACQQHGLPSWTSRVHAPRALGVQCALVSCRCIALAPPAEGVQG